jgi:hypothetical protein
MTDVGYTGHSPIGLAVGSRAPVLGERGVRVRRSSRAAGAPARTADVARPDLSAIAGPTQASPVDARTSWSPAGVRK